MKVTIIPIVIGAFGIVTKGDSRRLIGTQTPVKNHLLTLMRKTLKE